MMRFISFLVGKDIHVTGEWHTLNYTGTETPVPGTLPDLAECTSSYGYSFVSFIIYQ